MGARAARPGRRCCSSSGRTRARLSRDWQSVLFFPVGIYILLALGPQHRRRARPACSTSATWRSSRSARTPRPSSRPSTALERRGQSLPLAIARGHGRRRHARRPTLRLRGDYLAIVTLGFGEIVRIVAQNSRVAGRGPRGITGIPHPSDSVARRSTSRLDPLPYYYLVLAAIVAGDRRRSCGSSALAVGRAWAAIREDEDAAELDGRAHLHDEAVGLRHRRVDRRAGRLDLRAARSSFINPDNFPFFLSVIDPRRRRARRHGLDPRRHRRRASPSPSCPSTCGMRPRASGSPGS